MTTDFYKFILGLRAIRSFRSQQLSDEDLDRILEAARWTGSAKNHQAWSFIVVTAPDQIEALAGCGDFTDPVRAAPTTIVIVQEPIGYEFDAGRAAQNIMLAARAVGVASCPITLHRDDDARHVLGVPADRRCRYAVALGYPSDEAAPARWGGRKAVDDLIHRNRYS